MRFGIGILLRRDGDVVPVEDEVWEMSIPYDADDDDDDGQVEDICPFTDEM